VIVERKYGVSSRGGYGNGGSGEDEVEVREN
jgi:hypothetical protein